MPTSFRALNYSLDPNSENYAKLQFLYEFLESEFHTVMMQEVRSSGIVYDKALIRNKSEFRNQFLADFGLRHKNNKWDAIKGCKAKYYRMSIRHHLHADVQNSGLVHARV